jgi:fructose-bisphosphate aldolase class II
LATTGDLVASAASVRFHGGRIAPLLSACGQIAIHSSASLAIHLDHFQDVTLVDEAIETAAELGATSIMVDAAHLPHRDNVDRTRTFARRAHAAGLWVEAELGEIGGKAGQKKDAHALGARTDPDEAAAFAEETGVDGLAVAVGSSHAMTTRDAHLDLELITRLAASVAIPAGAAWIIGSPRRSAPAGRRRRDPQAQRRDGARRRPTPPQFETSCPPRQRQPIRASIWMPGARPSATPSSTCAGQLRRRCRSG